MLMYCCCVALMNSNGFPLLLVCSDFASCAIYYSLSPSLLHCALRALALSACVLEHLIMYVSNHCTRWCLVIIGYMRFRIFHRGLSPVLVHYDLASCTCAVEHLILVVGPVTGHHKYAFQSTCYRFVSDFLVYCDLASCAFVSFSGAW